MRVSIIITCSYFYNYRAIFCLINRDHENRRWNFNFQAKTAKLAGILDVGILAAAVLLTHFAMHGDLRIDAIGFMGAGLNIVMYASPLAAMVRRFS